MNKYRRLLCKAIAFIFLLSNLLASMPEMQIVFAEDNPNKEIKDIKPRYEEREKTELIVKYKDSKVKAGNNLKVNVKDAVKNRVKQSLNLTKMDSKKKYDRFNIDILEIGKTDDMSKVISMLSSDPDVEYVQPNYKLEIQALPTDTRFNEQWGLLNSGQEVEGHVGRSGVDINASNAWNLTKGAATVVVGVLDTGIDINHNDLKNSIFKNTRETAGNNIDDDNNGYIDDVNGWDFVNADNTVYDSSSLDLHGTHVAGIIAASANSEGISGVAPNVKLLPLKFINGNWGYTCDAIDAIEYAMNMGVKVMNCSFGGFDNNFALKDTMKNSGILFVCSAGNRGADVAVSPVYPACFEIPNVLSVASIDSMGVISPYSSYGSKIHVAAPGINILSTTPENTYDYFSGTSASAPFVTGAAALLKSYVPALNYEQLSQRIKANVKPCTNLQGKVTSGGRVDANAALTNIKPAADTYTGPGNDTGTVPAGQQGGNEDTWYTQDQLAKIKEKLHYGEGGVNPASGNYSISSTDLSVPAPGFQINISRTYNSRDPKSTPMGQGWTFGFEGKVEGTDVVEVTLPSGGAQRFRLDGTTNKYVPEDSRSTFVKNTDNTYILTTKDQYKYYFNSSRYLYKMEDRNGNTINIGVSADGKVNTITDAVGRVFTVNYVNGLIDNITGPENTVIRYGYNAKKQLATVTDAEGMIMRYSYDTIGFITEIKDHYEKSVAKITYNHAEGENQYKVSQVIDSMGNTINYTYNMTEKKTTAADINNRTSTYWFDSSMYTIKEQDPEGKLTTTEYFLEGGKNKYGDIKSITDRNGNKTEYAIDDRGNVIKITNPKPEFGFKEYTYDDKNNLTMDRDESGISTYYIYDSEKKLMLKKAQPINGTDQYTAGCDESKFAITSYSYYTAAEAMSQFQTNAKGLLKSVKDPEGNETIYTYDIDGNIKTIKDPEQNVTTNTYNRLGLKTNVLSPALHNTSYEYDKNGLLIKQTLHGGETTRIIYDKEGRKLQEVQPNQYNSAVDNLANRQYNDSTAGYRYTYFDNGLLESVTDPENNTISYTYDVYGNKSTETRPNNSARPNNSVMRYEYDILDRLKKVYFKGSEAEPELLLYEYSYTILDDGRTQQSETRYLNDSETAITIEVYDYAGRLTEKQNPDGSYEKTVYRPNGKIASQSARNGSITYLKYDGLDRLSEQWTPIEVLNGSMLYRYSSWEYDKAGKTTKEMTGKEKVALYELPTNYISKSYSYYRNGQVKTITDLEGRKTEYSYDSDGNLSGEDIYTEEGTNNILTTEYENNYLGKPTEKKVHTAEGDIHGNAFGSTDDSVLLTTYSYDNNGNLKTQTTPDEVTTTYTYDKLNRQLTISQPGVDEEGTAVTISNSTTYDWEGNPLTRTDARGNTTHFEYDSRGNLLKAIDAEGGVAAYEYDRAGRKVVEVSPKNYDAEKNLQEMNRIEYVYDVMDRTIAKLDIYMILGTNRWKTLHSRSYKYDISGNLVKELDALGYEAGKGDRLDERIATGYGNVYTYDLEGKLVTMLDPVTDQRGLAYTIRNEYDAAGRKTAVTNAKGVSTIYAYDDAGNVLSVRVKKPTSEDSQLTAEYTYDLAGRKLTETDGNRNTMEYQYNGMGKVRKATYPGDDTIDANIVVYQYNLDGNLAYKKDSMDRVELYTYDNQDRVLTFTEQEEDGSDPIILSYKYDKNGNKRYEFDGNNNRRENRYDELNRLIETIMVVEGTTKSTVYTYDANGNQTTTTDWRGNTYTNTYDPLNRLVEKADPYTTVQKLEYNDNSLQIKSYDALNNLTQYIYDSNGRLITTIDPADHITNQTYDDVGNMDSKSDGRGISTAYSYDELNRLVSVTDTKGTTSYTYDLNGNMLAQKDAKGNITTYEYNVANKLVRRMDHGGKLGAHGSYTYILAKTEAYTYYVDGNLKTKKDRNGKTTNYTYDIHGRLLSQQIGTEEISYTYDGNGNQLTMTDTTGTTTREYDAENRVLTKTVPNIGAIQYEYDILEAAGGYSERSTDPKGNISVKVYDKVGRLSEVTEGNDTTSYEYYSNGSRKSVIYPEGSREDYTYYDDNLLKTLVNKKANGTVLDSYSYSYDGAHNQTSKTDSKGETKYEYDSLNRLAKVTEPSGKTTSYLYDEAGNRTHETVLQETEQQGKTSTMTTYEYNEQNRLTGTVTTSGFVTEKVRYEYDNNGNTVIKVKETTKPVEPDMSGSFAFARAGTSTTREAAFMEYNVWNQMVKTIDGDKTLTYRYNGEGYRVEKSVNGQMTRYMYEADKVILEVDGQGNETATNVYGSNLLTRTAGDEQYYYMYNGHGDVTALIGTDGKVAATYYYDAFGNITEQSGEVKNPIRYAGYQYDEETGVYYLNARYYDPKIARFLTEDSYRGSAADPLSLNLYTYCYNEPVIYTDPSGHTSQSAYDRGAQQVRDQVSSKESTKSLADKLVAQHSAKNSTKNEEEKKLYQGRIDALEKMLQDRCSNNSSKGNKDSNGSNGSNGSKGSKGSNISKEELYQGLLFASMRAGNDYLVKGLSQAMGISSPAINGRKESGDVSAVTVSFIPSDGFGQGKDNAVVINTAKTDVVYWLRACGFYSGSYKEYYDDKIKSIEIIKESQAAWLWDFSTSVGISVVEGAKAAPDPWQYKLVGGGLGLLKGAISYGVDPGVQLKLEYDLERYTQIRDNLGDYQYLMTEKQGREDIIQVCDRIQSYYTNINGNINSAIAKAGSDGMFFDRDTYTNYSVDKLKEIVELNNYRIDYTNKIKQININYKESRQVIDKLFDGFY